MLFSIFIQLISSWLHGSCSVFAPGVLWFFCFVLHGRSGIFEFFCLKSSNCSSLKLILSVDPSFFVRSVCYNGALELRLHVIALPASLDMSWLAEITKKLKRSWLDFLVLVLQRPNSFILNASFNFASVNFFLAKWFRFNFRLQGLVVLLFCSP